MGRRTIWQYWCSSTVNEFMKNLLLLALLASATFGQTTVYLRSSAPRSVNVTGIANGTPPVITTDIEHGFAAGDTVFLFGACTGNNGILDPASGRSPVNGIFTVASSPAPTLTTYAINDRLSGNPIVGNGPMVNCEPDWNSSTSSPWTGKLTAYTLGAGPLGYLDGIAGPKTRKLALGTHNGLVSATITTANRLDVVTSYTHNIAAGDKISITGSGNTNLDHCNGCSVTGAYAPYTVLASPAPTATTFSVTTSGVPSGTYSNANNHCGPSSVPDDTIGGTQDCLRISQLAYVGNVFWDSLVADFDTSLSGNGYKTGYEGGSMWPVGNGSYQTAAIYGLAAFRLFVDQQNTQAMTALAYGMINVAKESAANWICNTDIGMCAIQDFVGNSDETFLGLSGMAMIGLPYLSAAHRQLFIDQIYNDVDDVKLPVSSTAHADWGRQKANRVITTGRVAAGTNDASHITLDPSAGSNNYVGNAIGLYYTTNITSITTGTSTTIAVASPIGTQTKQVYITGVTGTGTCARLNTLRGIASIQSDSTHFIAPLDTSGCTSPTGGIVTSGPLHQTDPVYGQYVFAYGIVTAYDTSTHVATIDAAHSAWVTPTTDMSYRILETVSFSSAAAKTAGSVVTGYNTHFTTDLAVGDGLTGLNAYEFSGAPYVHMYKVTSITNDTSLVATSGFSAATFAANPTASSIMWISKQWQTGDVGLNWIAKNWPAAVGAQPVLYNGGGYAVGAGFGIIPGSNNATLYDLGQYMLGISVAPYDARGALVATRHQAHGFDYDLIHAMAYNTGPSHYGGFYSPGTILAIGEMQDAFADTIPTFPAIDTTWMKNTGLWSIYSTYPDLQNRGAVLVPTQMGYAAYTGTGGYLAEGDPVMYKISDPIFPNYPQSKLAGYLRYWEQHAFSGVDMWDSGKRVLYQQPTLMIRNDPRIPSISYTSLPTQYAFLKSSQPAVEALGGWGAAYGAQFGGFSYLSRTSWTDRTSGLAFFGARSWSDDHDQPWNGTLQYFKVGGLIGWDGWYGLSNQGEDMTQRGDMVRFANNSRNVQPGPLSSNPLNHGDTPITKWASANKGSNDYQFGDSLSRYVAACADLRGVYTIAITWAQQCTGHLKNLTINSGTGEEILFDSHSIVLPSAMPIERHIHYTNNLQPDYATLVPASVGVTYNEGETTCPGGCDNVNTNRVILSLEDGSGPDSVSNNPQRKYGIITNFLSPSPLSMTIRADSYPLSVVSVITGSATTIHVIGHGLVTGAQDENMVLVRGDGVAFQHGTGQWAPFNNWRYGPYPITKIDADNFTIPIDSTGFTDTFDAKLNAATYYGDSSGSFRVSVCGGSSCSIPVATLSPGTTTDVTTLKPHGLSSGDVATLSGVGGGTPELCNGSGVATVISPTHYTMAFNTSGCTWIASYGGYSSRPGAAVTTYKTLIIHKVSQDRLTDTTLTSTPLNVDANWFGAQTKDKVIVINYDTVLHSSIAGFTTTHSGTAQYLFVGFAPGSYAVTINGTPITGSPFTVASANDSTIYFESTAGAVAITGTPSTCAVTTSSLAGGTTGGSYSASLTATGCTGSLTWGFLYGSAPSGTLLNPSTGVIAGKTINHGTFPLTVTLTDSSSPPITVNSAPLSITVTTGPSLLVSPISLTFACVTGGSDPATQPVSISANGVTLDNWSATKSLAQTTLSPSSGLAAGTMTVGITGCGGLSVGSHSDTVVVSSTTTGIPGSVSIPITINVGSSSPTLTASPSTLNFTCVAGGSNPVSQNIAVGESGGTLDQFSASKTQSWLSLSPTSGTVAGNVAVSVTGCAGLGVGTVTDTVTITSSTAGITGSPKTVGVTLHVNAPPPPVRMDGIRLMGPVIIH